MVKIVEHCCVRHNGVHHLQRAERRPPVEATQVALSTEPIHFFAFIYVHRSLVDGPAMLYAARVTRGQQARLQIPGSHKQNRTISSRSVAD